MGNPENGLIQISTLLLLADKEKKGTSGIKFYGRFTSFIKSSGFPQQIC